MAEYSTPGAEQADAQRRRIPLTDEVEDRGGGLALRGLGDDVRDVVTGDVVGPDALGEVACLLLPTGARSCPTGATRHRPIWAEHRGLAHRPAATAVRR